VRTIRHTYQPERSSLCGQTCVAMITGRPLPDVIKNLFSGKTGGTSTKDVMSALQKAGEKTSSLERVKKTTVFDTLSLCRLHFVGEKNHSHWVVIAEVGGKMSTFDPSIGVYVGFKADSYPTSYLEIKDA